MAGVSDLDINSSLVSSLYSSVSPICAVVLTLGSPQAVTDGLVSTLPSHPLETINSAITTEQIKTAFTNYTDHYKRIIALCKQRVSHDAFVMIVKKWRTFLSSLYTKGVSIFSSEQLSSFNKTTVLFELIKLVCVAKDFDNPIHLIQSHSFTNTLQAIADTINSALTEHAITHCDGSQQQDNHLPSDLGLYCEWLDVAIETSTLSNGNAGIINQIMASILKSIQRLVSTMMDKTSPHCNSSVSVMVIANCLHCIYDQLRSLYTKWEKVSSSYQVHGVSLWVGQYYDDLISHILAYQTQLCTFSILQDTNSQDWSNPKPFYEGNRISFHIQMWHLYLFGLRADLWRHAPPQAAVRILRKVLSNTLDTLTVHYSTMESPSEKRQPQYRGDIVFILITVSSLLPSITDSAPSLAPHPLILLIHTHCSSLLTLLSNRSPPNTIHSASVSSSTNDEDPSLISSWQNNLPLSQYGLSSYHGNHMTISEMVQSITSLPYPPWNLVIKLLISNKCQYAIQECITHPPLCPHVMAIIQHYHHYPAALYTFVEGIKESDEACSAVVGWVADIMTSQLESIIINGAVEFVSNGIRNGHDSESLVIIINSLVDQIVLTIDQLESQIITVLSLLSKELVYEILQTVLNNITNSSSVMSSVPNPIIKWYDIFRNTLYQLFTLPDAVVRLTTVSIEKNREKLHCTINRLHQQRSMSSGSDQLIETDYNIIHEVITSNRDTKSLEAIFNCIITNNKSNTTNDQLLFDPVITSTSIGSKPLNHEELMYN